jgi:GxxExxY protein
MLNHEEITNQIISAAIEVHKELGLGLLESAYEICLCRELDLRNVRFVCQHSLPITYKGVLLECGYKLDLVVSDAVVVELKSVDELAAIHEAQLLTYLRLSKKRVGLLNFNVPLLKDGIKRLVL